MPTVVPLVGTVSLIGLVFARRARALPGSDARTLRRAECWFAAAVVVEVLAALACAEVVSVAVVDMIGFWAVYLGLALTIGAYAGAPSATVVGVAHIAVWALRRRRRDAVAAARPGDRPPTPR